MPYAARIRHSAIAHVARRALFTLLVVATPAHAATPGNPEVCAPAPPAAERRLHELIGVVSRGDVNTMRSYTDSAWAVEHSASHNSDAIAGELVMLHWKSRGYQTGAACEAGTDRAGALVRNALTGEIDSVAVTVEPDAPHRVRKLDVKLGAGTPVAAEDTASEALRLATVDRLARRLADAGAFSGVVLVTRDGRPVYHQAFGSADRLRRVPMRRDARFNVGALSETMTAVAVLQQVEAGRLALADSLGTLGATGLPSGARGVHVAELLAHVGGLSTALDARDGAPGFARGDGDYRALGLVLERASGQRWEDYMCTRVLDAANMGETTVAARRSDVVGYSVVATTLGAALKPEPSFDAERGDAAGGMRTTAMDLARFAHALREGRLLRPETVMLMRTPQAALGAPGYGFGIVRWRGDDLWGAAGDPAGGDADLEIYGESGYVAVILSNISGANDPIRRRLAAVMPTTALSGLRMVNLE